MTFDTGPQSSPKSPGSRAGPLRVAAAVPPIDRLNRSYWKGPDNNAPLSRVKTIFAVFLRGTIGPTSASKP